MKKHKILYTEDDTTIAFLTKDNLENTYDIVHCNNGFEAYHKFKEEEFDICILDIMIPEIDGFELATLIRKTNLEIPILFISAKTLKEDRIKGLQIGADDYIVKPFNMEELKLKIEIFLKRSKKNITTEKSQYKIGNYFFDFNNYLIYKNDENILLTQREAELLKLFLDNQNIVLKREEILQKLWGTDDYFLGRSLDVFISRLRKILATEENIEIKNLHGIGFKFIYEK